MSLSYIEEFVIDKSQSDLIKENIEAIYYLFETEVNFETIIDENANQQWINLKTKDKKNISNAREFIKSVCNPEYVEFYSLNRILVKKLQQIEFKYELIKNYGIFIKISGDQIIIQGKKENVSNLIKKIDSDCMSELEANNEITKKQSTAASSYTLETEKNEFEIEDQKLAEALWLKEIQGLDINFFKELNTSKENSNEIHNEKNKYNMIQADNDPELSKDSNLRFIVIDGSNIAIEHGKELGKGKVFSCKGIKIVVEHFIGRGHKQIKALVPRFRRGNSDIECPSINPEILDELEKSGYLTYTPSRYVNNRLILPYDDRFILKAALHYNAIIVSNDNYKDLMQENNEWKRHIQTSLLQYSFMGDLFMIADDPMGRRGPNIDQFLSVNTKKSSIQNLKKNTFNQKNKIYESNHKSANSSQKSTSAHQSNDMMNNLMADKRNEEETGLLFEKLIEIFPNFDDNIIKLLNEHQCESDINYFTQILLN